MASGYQTLVLFEGREHSSQLSHLSNPVLKLLGVDINTGFMYMYLCFFFHVKTVMIVTLSGRGLNSFLPEPSKVSICVLVCVRGRAHAHMHN